MTEEATDQQPLSAIICSFCRKSAPEVSSMVAGAGVFICDECVGLCVDIIKSKPANMPKVTSWEKRVSDEELLSHLPNFTAASAQMDRELGNWVTEARRRGITWTKIGTALGMTRQSAWERFSGEE